MHESKDVQEPHNHHNDHDSIQDRLNGSCHGNETVDQPEENSNYDQNYAYLNQRHDLLPPFIQRRTPTRPLPVLHG